MHTRQMNKNILIILLTYLISVTIPLNADAQRTQKNGNTHTTVSQFRASHIASALEEDTQCSLMHYIIEGKDTIFIDELPASKIYSRLPRQKGREWRQYYRLVHNFSKTYPYAKVARTLVTKADSTIAADNLKRGKKDRYVNGVQRELFEVFEKPLRNLTVSQGALLMKLIDREVGKSSYSIIKDYKSGMAAGFWQGIAKLFGSDLKKPYDPEGEDRPVEELVEIWEAGEFQALYFALFWEDPPIIEIPENYL